MNILGKSIKAFFDEFDVQHNYESIIDKLHSNTINQANYNMLPPLGNDLSNIFIPIQNICEVIDEYIR